MIYILSASIDGASMASEFSNVKTAANAAWSLCEDNELYMPSGDWYFDHPRYGKRSCYNMMVPAGNNWECDTVFIKFMKDKAGRCGSVRISSANDDDFIQIKSKRWNKSSIRIFLRKEVLRWIEISVHDYLYYSMTFASKLSSINLQINRTQKMAYSWFICAQEYSSINNLLKILLWFVFVSFRSFFKSIVICAMPFSWLQ